MILDKDYFFFFNVYRKFVVKMLGEIVIGKYTVNIKSLKDYELFFLNEGVDKEG